MTSHIRTDSQTDNERCMVLIGEGKQITDSHHDVIFLISVGIFSYKEEITQILLGGFELYDPEITIGSCAGKASVSGFISGCDGSDHGSVAIGIRGWNRFKGIFGTESRINLLFCILCSITDRENGRGMRLSGRIISQGLIPDSEDSRGTILILEQRILIIDSRINETDHDASPLFRKGRKFCG